jgi:arabinofuranosyltransferase
VTRPPAPPAPGPAREPWFHPLGPYVVPLALALAARIDAARGLTWAAEDAYITFRYAENWARGLGPVYNAGERVFGYTSPLWTAWLALGAALGIDTFAWARAWGIVLSLVGLVLFTRLLDRSASRAAAWAFAVFFALFPAFAAHAVMGMESGLLVAALAAAALAVEVRSRGAGVCLALLALVRPEAFVVALALSVLAGGRARLVAFGLVAAVAIALGLYYGSPVPQSVLAKAATYGIGQGPPSLDWIEGFVPVFLADRWQNLLEAQHLFVLSLLALPATILGLHDLFRRRPVSTIGVAAAACLLVLLVYTVLGVPYFAWYLVLPLTGWALAAATGLPGLVRHRLVWAALAVYVVTDARFLSGLYVSRNATEARLFIAAADRLKAHSAGRGTVFLEPIGHIGYRTGLRVIDEVGLVSPDVPRRRRRGAGWYADVIRERRPEYLVIRPGPFLDNQALAGVSAPFRSQAERDSILAAYDLVGAPPQSTDELAVLVRKPSPAP